MQFQGDALRHVIGYVGPGNYMFLSAVYHPWNRQYRLVHGPKKITSAAAASSLSTLLMYMSETDDGDTTPSTFVDRLLMGLNDFAGAASGSRLGVLQWARANGCPWDATTCSLAAYGGRLSVLQ